MVLLFDTLNLFTVNAVPDCSCSSIASAGAEVVGRSPAVRSVS